jgi:hypothetical protein
MSARHAARSAYPIVRRFLRSARLAFRLTHARIDKTRPIESRVCVAQHLCKMACNRFAIRQVYR